LIQRLGLAVEDFDAEGKVTKVFEWFGYKLHLIVDVKHEVALVYDEQGTIHCYDRTSHPIVLHRMAYNGYEAERGTLKYRCPARHEGWTCPHDAVCNEGKEYGRTVRVKSDIDAFQRDPKAWLAENLNPRRGERPPKGYEQCSNATMDWIVWTPRPKQGGAQGAAP
jgi:hypothetical protein